MSDRKKVLELFEEQKELLDKRINEGIEKYRKGDAAITVTDNNGACAFRVFFGMYELEISANGKTVKKIIDVSSSSDNLITVTL